MDTPIPFLVDEARKIEIQECAGENAHRRTKVVLQFISTRGRHSQVIENLDFESAEASWSREVP